MLAARQCQLSEEARKRLVHLCEAQVDLNDPMSGNARSPPPADLPLLSCHSQVRPQPPGDCLHAPGREASETSQENS
eukprot:676741-Hanusia_phi.AAC.1